MVPPVTRGLVSRRRGWQADGPPDFSRDLGLLASVRLVHMLALLCPPDTTLFVDSASFCPALCPLLESVSCQPESGRRGGQGTRLCSLLLWSRPWLWLPHNFWTHYSVAYPFIFRGTNGFLLAVFVLLIVLRCLQIVSGGVDSVSGQVRNCYKILRGHEKQPRVQDYVYLWFSTMLNIRIFWEFFKKLYVGPPLRHSGLISLE